MGRRRKKRDIVKFSSEEERARVYNTLVRGRVPLITTILVANGADNYHKLARLLGTTRVGASHRVDTCERFQLVKRLPGYRRTVLLFVPENVVEWLTRLFGSYIALALASDDEFLSFISYNSRPKKLLLNYIHRYIRLVMEEYGVPAEMGNGPLNNRIAAYVLRLVAKGWPLDTRSRREAERKLRAYAEPLSSVLGQPEDIVSLVPVAT